MKIRGTAVGTRTSEFGGQVSIPVGLSSGADLSLKKCGTRLYKQSNTDNVVNQGNIDCNTDDQTNAATSLNKNNTRFGFFW